MIMIRAAHPEDAGCVLELARKLATAFMLEENRLRVPFLRYHRHRTLGSRKPYDARREANG
jgi:hypothetical protein